MKPSRTNEILNGIAEQNKPAVYNGRSGYWCQAECVFIEAAHPTDAIQKYRTLRHDIAINHNNGCSEIMRLRAMREGKS